MIFKFIVLNLKFDILYFLIFFDLLKYIYILICTSFRYYWC